MRLRFTSRAAQDLTAIAEYIGARNPAASLRLRGAILESLQDLVLWPEIGRRQSVEGVRKLVIRKYRYLVYYTLDAMLKKSSSLQSSIHHASESMKMRNPTPLPNKRA
jgi:toxin ParE1/3/4